MDAKEHAALDGAVRHDHTPTAGQSKQALQDIAFGSVSTGKMGYRTQPDRFAACWHPGQIHRVSFRHCKSQTTVTAPRTAALHWTA